MEAGMRVRWGTLFRGSRILDGADGLTLEREHYRKDLTTPRPANPLIIAPTKLSRPLSRPLIFFPRPLSLPLSRPLFFQLETRSKISGHLCGHTLGISGHLCGRKLGISGHLCGQENPLAGVGFVIDS